MRALLTALFLSFVAALPGQAQTRDTASTILVLDASGSMWGQIDGVNKIVIAREVIGDLLTQIPDDMALGLTMYGHNRRGDCSDIETMVQPGLNNRDQIAAIVNSVNPRGRTPLSEAVIQAANALRYTENPATVILVSDGRETCDADPCAVGRALEESGIDFTAHVIGFDVSAAEDQAQLQCLAENTGGQFLTADNADELADALAQVAVAPPPPPANITFQAVVEPDNSAPVSPLVWEVFDMAGNQIVDAIEAPSVIAQLPAGDYRVQVYRVTAETEHGGTFVVQAGVDQTVIIPLPQLIPEASLTAPESAPIRSIVSVEWTGPGAEGDYIQLALADRSMAVSRAELDVGNFVSITMPAAPGDYVFQYVHAAMNAVLAEATISVTPPPVQITAPASAVAGSTIQVQWFGAFVQGDFIAAGHPGQQTYATHAQTSDGNPVDLRVPSQPGQYELRYYQGRGREVLATVILDVTPALATLDAPTTAEIGQTIQVGWTGPAYDPDFIAVAEIGANTHINYSLTRDGSPADLVMPPEPGTYEIRYVMQQDREVIATRTIEVTDILASLDAPATATAGSTIQVGWQGPGYQNDFISVADMDDRGANSVNYSYTRDGNPVSLQMPVDPGQYEIRYILSQNRQILARVVIDVTPVGATIDAPASAAAGQTISVGWTGPDYDNDFISIAPVGAADNSYENYSYTREGAPVDLVMPVDPGQYEIRYIVNQDRTAIARTVIEVTAIGATIDAPTSANAGETISVGWTGPDYHNDFIAISRIDDARGYENYSYTRDGTPLDLVMPTTPGDYEIRYVVNQDREIIARTVITVGAVSAGIDAPQTAVAGETIQVGWTGPDYHNDFIAISRIDDERGYENYSYTRDGTPLDLEIPTEPGSYEIRYIVNQDREIIARTVIEVTPVSAGLNAPGTAVVGETINVTWTGPDYHNDFIAISRTDDARGYENYTYTRDGSPSDVLIPSEPGSYEIRYIVNQDRTIIARVALTVMDLSVTLDAPATGVAGSTIQVRHNGPDYRNDFIGIGVPGNDRQETYGRTSNGNPVSVDLPDEPGQYEVRYYMNQDRRIIGRVPITVTAQ